MKQSVRVWAAASMAMALGWHSTASAFCRTTTCDSRTDTCTTNAVTGCPEGGGVPLFWGSSCVSFSLQKDASPQVSFDDARAVIRRSFDAWQSVECDAQHHVPSISFADLSPVECAEDQFNEQRGNANIISFRQAWPFASDDEHTLALTTVTFNDQTGEIYDADIDVDADLSRMHLLSVTTPVPSGYSDLQSIMTHEVGHLLGLAHSKVDCPEATADTCPTMFNFYAGGTLTFRSLAPDDRDAVCSLYPPSRMEPLRGTSCSPAHGFAQDCGPPDQHRPVCSVAHGVGTPTATGHGARAQALALAVACGLLIGARRRRAGRSAGR